MFKGTVRYVDKDDTDYLVIELIERDDHIAIRATTTWGEYGTWTIDSVAKKQGDIYSTRSLYPTAGKEPTSQKLSDFLASISIKIVSRSNESITVKGVWREQGEIYPFAGELELA